MYLSIGAASKSAKIVAFFTLFAVIISLVPASAFAQEATTEPTEPVTAVDVCLNIDGIQDVVPADTVLDTATKECVEKVADTVPSTESQPLSSANSTAEAVEGDDEEAPKEACEVEGHKYDEAGNPLSGWVIGLMKTISYNNGKDLYDLATDITNEDGYFCLEWDGETRVIREDTESSYIDGAYTFFYSVFEKMKAGWKNVSIEKGPDFLDLDVATKDEISTNGEYISVQIGEEGGYIYADAEYHVDFYNTEIDPCDEDRDDIIKVAKINEDPCDDNDKETISGYKFNDKNSNGIWDKDEAGIAGWEINLDQEGASTTHATTDANGYYSFSVDEGFYKVTETQQKGWEQTATIGDGADGDICFITVEDEIVEAVLDDNNDEDVVDDYTCDFGNHEIIQEPVCAVGENLLVNGSFEDPEVDGDWNIFSTVTGWTIALSDGLELWANGFYGGASDGNQNAELDGNAPTKITHNTTTVPGATYELRFDFSARPDADAIADNNVDGLVNGIAIMNATADGSDIAVNTWSTQAQTFVATGTSTEIGFEDKGTANSYGSLIDNAVLCLVRNPNNGGDDTDNDTPRRNGGGGSGTRVKRAPAGEVLGASVSTPTGQVLGDATSTLPVGAPNTGSGGTSPVVVLLPTIVAVLPKTEKIK